MSIHQTLNQALISTVIMASLLTPIITNATDAEPNPNGDIEYPNKGDQLSPCGLEQSLEEINQLPTPEATQIGKVSYISGGSCSDSVLQMKGLADSFPLEVVLVEKEGDKEVYIADVKVHIIDAKNNSVLDVVTDGAFLLVKLPDGQYHIIAEYNYASQRKRVSINHNKHERVVFLWANEPKADKVSE